MWNFKSSSVADYSRMCLDNVKPFIRMQSNATEVGVHANIVVTSSYQDWIYS